MNKLAHLVALTSAIFAAIIVAAVCLSRPGPAPVSAQAVPTVHITAPANGATVNNPVTVAVQSSGAVIKPATDNDPNAAHYHYFIDRNPSTVLQPGQPIPTGQPDIIHTDSASQQLPALSPGQHTVWVVLAHTDHTPYNPNVQDQVTFTVAGAGQAAAAGAAEPAPGGAAPLPPVVGRGGLLPPAGQQSGAVPSLQRATEEHPWLPLIVFAGLAAVALGAGLEHLRRAG